MSNHLFVIRNELQKKLCKKILFYIVHIIIVIYLYSKYYYIIILSQWLKAY